MLSSSTMLASRSTGNSSVDSLVAVWLRGEFGKFGEFCGGPRCSADVILAPGPGLCGRIVVVRAFLGLCNGQKPSGFLVLLLHLLCPSVWALQRLYPVSRLGASEKYNSILTDPGMRLRRNIAATVNRMVAPCREN